MQDKSIREPFNDNFRDLNVGFISHKCIDIFVRGISGDDNGRNCRLAPSL